MSFKHLEGTSYFSHQRTCGALHQGSSIQHFKRLLKSHGPTLVHKRAFEAAKSSTMSATDRQTSTSAVMQVNMVVL